MDDKVKPTLPGEITRKRACTPTQWKRNKAKVLRYTAKSFPRFPECSHSKGAFQCRTLSAQEVRRFHDKFYSKKDKIYQDNFILKCTQSIQKNRKRITTGRYQTQQFQSKYYIPNRVQKLVPVCLKAFLAILNVSRFRINVVLKSFRKTGCLASENRGGDHVSEKNRQKKESVMQFINSLNCTETHYCCVKTGRCYLSSELSICKLWKMYMLVEGNLPVKECYFRSIFNRHYNLGFGSPRVDVCSTCLQLQEKIKKSSSPPEKVMLITEKRVHKLRAKAFYELLKENNPGILTFSFDCEKNLPLPKIPDQSTYYSRQIYLNNFTVVRGHSKSSLNVNNVTSYVWTENEFKKGSNEISSCLFNALKNADMPPPYNTLRLVCDGCAGQNKNAILTTMLFYWFNKFAPKNIKEIQIVYPVTGHSFLPPDRVFGLVEKQLRKMESIITPQEYINIIKEHASIKRLGDEGCKNFDWKNEKDVFIKAPAQWHFKLQSCKRMFIKRHGARPLIQGETYYKNQVNGYGSIIKPRMFISNMDPKLIKKTVSAIKIQKKNDVDSLLKKHYGDKWREETSLKFYKEIIDDYAASDHVEEGGDQYCNPQEETPVFTV